MSDSDPRTPREPAKKANRLLGSLFRSSKKTRREVSSEGKEDEKNAITPKPTLVRFPAPSANKDDVGEGQYGELPEFPSVPASIIGSGGRSVKEDHRPPTRVKPKKSSKSREVIEETEVMLHKSTDAKSKQAAREKVREKVKDSLNDKPERDGEFSYAYDTALKMTESSSKLATRLQRKLGPQHAEAKTVKHLSSMLSEQLKWLETNQALLQGLPLDSLETLSRLYNRVRQTVSDDQYMAKEWTDRQQKNIAGLEKILEGGPRYLFALALFEALAFQVELVNANASASIDEITKMLKAAREDANGLNTYIKQSGQVLGRIDPKTIVDKKGKSAWKDCMTLFKQLQSTVQQFFADDPVAAEKSVSDPAGPKSILKEQKGKTSAGQRTAEAPRPPSRAASVVSSTGTAVTAKTSQEEDEDDGTDETSLFNYNGQIVTRSAMELLEEEEAMVKRGIYEREGVLMTASALSLLQAQEAMERADTAGHGEWGPDTWDGIRGQYIPKWALKLSNADQWPLVDDDGKRLRDENGKLLEDWFDVNLDAVEARNFLLFGVEGVVDHPY